MRSGHKYISSHVSSVFQRNHLLGSRDFQREQRIFCKKFVVPFENLIEASEEDARITRFSRFAPTKLVMIAPQIN